MVQTGAGIYCSPAVEKDKVFVGDDMGQLLSLIHIWYTGLIVGLVPFAPACPLGFVEGTHVTHDVGLNQVCQVVAQVAGCSVGHAGANGTNPTMRPVYPAYLPCYSKDVYKRQEQDKASPTCAPNT